MTQEQPNRAEGCWPALAGGAAVAEAGGRAGESPLGSFRMTRPVRSIPDKFPGGDFLRHWPQAIRFHMERGGAMSCPLMIIAPPSR